MDKIRVSKSVVGEEEKKALARIIDEGYLGMGSEVQLFESEIRTVLLSQYSLEIIKRVEKIFSDSSPIDLSIKSSASEENYFKQLKGNSVTQSHFRLSQKTSLIKTKGYCAGDWWVQSLAASLPVKIAPMALKEKIVLDVCCAPGGKSFQLADNGAILTSIDKSEKRLRLMRESLSRLNFDFDVKYIDVFDYEPKKMFDIILLDPPCTATGTIGKNPDPVSYTHLTLPTSDLV